MSEPADDESNVDLAPPALTLAAALARGEDSAKIALDGGYDTSKIRKRS